MTGEVPPAGLEPGSVFAGYQILERIGAGGMGALYRARHPRLNRDEAIKVIGTGAEQAEMRARFVREAQLAGGLSHRHIVPVHNSGAEPLPDGSRQLWIAMAYVDAPDAQQQLDAHGPVAPGVLTVVAQQLAAALDYAHAQHILHRDVKPANVLLPGIATGRVEAMITDFGIASDISGEVTSLTRSGMLLGTLAYTPPEVLVGSRASPASDQYSLAATIYRLLTGLPYRRSEGPGPVPAAVAAVFARGLADDPGQRYPSCGEFAAAFTSAAVGPRRAVESQDAVETDHAPRDFIPVAPRQQAAAPMTPPAGMESRSGARRALPAAVALLCTALLAVLVLIVVNSGGDDAEQTEADDWGENAELAQAFPGLVSGNERSGRTCHNAIPESGSAAERAISCAYGESGLSYQILDFGSDTAAQTFAEGEADGVVFTWQDPSGWYRYGPVSGGDRGWARLVLTDARQRYVIAVDWSRDSTAPLPTGYDTGTGVQRPVFADLDAVFTNWLRSENFRSTV